MSASSEMFEESMNSAGSKDIGTQLRSKPTNVAQPVKNGTKTKKDAQMNGSAHANRDKMHGRGDDENSQSSRNDRNDPHDNVQLRPHVSVRLYHKADKPKKHNGNGKLVSGNKADSRWEHSRYVSCSERKQGLR